MAPVPLTPDVVPLVVGLGGAPRLAISGTLGCAVSVALSAKCEGEGTFDSGICSSYSRAPFPISCKWICFR